jgi:hypothetical protein
MRKVQDYLDTGDALRRLSHEARRLSDLDRVYRKVVPAALAEASGVARVEGGTLVLWADSGAIAAKLRQLSPTLLGKLAELAPQCSAIRVAVIIRVREPTGKRRPPPKVGMQAAEALQGLARELPPCSLKSALLRLAGQSEDGK